LRIAGFVPASFVDWEGKVSFVVFARGCNFRCFYCQNFALISPEGESIPVRSVLREIEERRSFLDGVVISGGEPTLQEDLGEFCRVVRGMGLGVKLDTNGSRPEVLWHLIKEGLLDFVAMDVKAPLHKYSQVAGLRVDLNAVLNSVEILRSYLEPHQYEFRTTVAMPPLSPEDLKEIRNMIGPSPWVLQKLCPENMREAHPCRAPEVRELEEVAPGARLRGW